MPDPDDPRHLLTDPLPDHAEVILRLYRDGRLHVEFGHQLAHPAAMELLGLVGGMIETIIYATNLEPPPGPSATMEFWARPSSRRMVAYTELRRD